MGSENPLFRVVWQHKLVVSLLFMFIIVAAVNFISYDNTVGSLWFQKLRPTKLTNFFSVSGMKNEKLVVSHVVSRGTKALDKTLFEHQKVFCWVVTSPSRKHLANAVKATWIRRCNGHIFISSSADKTLPAVNSGAPEGRKYSWALAEFGMRYAYNNVLDQYDWFMKIDDDSYVVLDNARKYLQKFSRNKPVYLGRRLKQMVPVEGFEYVQGGAGYILNKIALKSFVEEGLETGLCKNEHGAEEDIDVGLCFYKLGITPTDDRDGEGKATFFPESLTVHMSPGHMKTNIFEQVLVNPEKDFFECCSKHAISFHHLKEMEIYLMEFLLHRLVLHRLDR